uniref:UDP-N-acetylglucosamine--dolichyl-phosphate N-acetylglucosaminephosphotransferase isoform X1 n=1 Tax=Myxine glutinosa TaxID=7769 RepID=UPI00358EF4DF
MDYLPLCVNVAVSVLAGFVTFRAVPAVAKKLLAANLFGKDLNKDCDKRIPEALGVVSGAIFLVMHFALIPVPSLGCWLSKNCPGYPQIQLVQLLAALLALCCMLLLGFADDVLNLPWRHKLALPAVAALPLLTTYLLTEGPTTVLIPEPLRPLLGLHVHLGALYYVYMGLLCVFCTNAINILAGVNGLEAGQTVIIAASIAIFNLIELHGDAWYSHLFSLYFMVPLLCTTLGLLYHNWFPANVFVGDTFCYFAGMAFAVVGILGHFGKTMLLFFMPQLFNFAYSAPQLFHLLPCPRHRIPRFDRTSGKLDVSFARAKVDDISLLGHLVLRIGDCTGLISVRWKVDPDEAYVEFGNLTLLNLLLLHFGRVHERTLTLRTLSVQVLGSVLAFTIRYPLARIFYES